ncbi:MAG: ATP-grasp domain-containing protein [Candidatus Shapirobacteria bacterium]|nr:ATP-grasp domain-containing protein [Candidatus Shapirobacteria bacterium]
MNLIEIINQSNYDFYFLCVDKFLDINLPQLKNFYSINPESLNIKISQKNSGRFLSHSKTIEFITQNSAKTKHKIAIIPFKPSSKIDLICQKQKWTNISNQTYLSRQLEDKIKFFKICQQNHITTIPSIIDNFTSENFSKYQKLFGSNLVIQTRFGWAGNSTFADNSYDNLKNKISPNSPVKFSPLLAGYSLINNCCLTQKGLIQSPPALQYTGIPSLTQNPFATVGRQWPSFAPKKIISEIKNITQNFTKILKKMNYQGFFGLDFLVSNDHVFLIECNPRLTASFAFYTKLEMKQNLNPLFLFHLAEFIKIKSSINIKQEQERFQNPNIIGSEIILRNQLNNTIKKYNDFIPFSTKIDPISLPDKIIKALHENN